MANFVKSIWYDKQQQVVLFASTAIALYGYDQGMMSLINTNYDYLSTMDISSDSPLVGVLVSVYYLGCAVGAVIASWWADTRGRKSGMFLCLATSAIGNLICFLAGLGVEKGAFWVMFAGRVVMGLGVGGIDSVVPVYSSELSEDEARGKALAQEFQMNILGLNMAFAINLAVTVALGKYNQWAWRIPIVCMQIFPVVLMALIERLPESPRFLVKKDRTDDATSALNEIYPSGAEDDSNKQKLDELVDNHGHEAKVTYREMFTPGHMQFHPTMITIMGQVNQALTGYGAISVYGPQIFELLGFGVTDAEFLTQGNYLSYLGLMTFAWLLIDAVGRRSLMVTNSVWMTVCFLLLTLFAYLSMKSYDLDIPNIAVAVPGCVALFIATGNFGIGWLAQVWLIPTEIFPTTARAKGTAVSVIIWGIANFGVTFITPVLFNNLSFWIFLVFALTNSFAGLWTYVYQPETGGRSFEENQVFFEEAKKAGSWRVSKVRDGAYRYLPGKKKDDDENDLVGERAPLLSRVRDQI
ncbi:MAG: hypothetical protein M1828_002604 [Chrysothrix sp. TS-e1954]|nr:MAG: hypothetical protein M1828_002604 [Chrysothrix sp. TS-e1954]